MLLSKKIEGFRCDRPSEWMMDEYMRDAEKLETELTKAKEKVEELEEIVAFLYADAEQGDDL